MHAARYLSLSVKLSQKFWTYIFIMVERIYKMILLYSEGGEKETFSLFIMITWTFILFIMITWTIEFHYVQIKTSKPPPGEQAYRQNLMIRKWGMKLPKISLVYEFCFFFFSKWFTGFYQPYTFNIYWSHLWTRNQVKNVRFRI